MFYTVLCFKIVICILKEKRVYVYRLILSSSRNISCVNQDKNVILFHQWCMFYIMFIAIKTAYVELFVVRPPDGSHYTQKTTKRRPHGFCRFMKKHKKD